MRLIDADAIQIPKTHADAFENCRNCELLDADQVREIIDNAPTIEPKRGKWIDFKNGWKCNACEKWNSEKSSFCPNCGADMRGKDDETSD